MLRLKTFGGLWIESADGAAEGAPRPRGLALLAILAAAGRKGVSRDRLLGILWPETDVDRARHALSQALYSLRRDLSAEIVISTPDLRLDAQQISSDIEDFRSAVRARNWKDAGDLYVGPFLDGFYLTDAPEFERWAETERTALATDGKRALEELAREHGASGRSQDAAEGWRRLTRLDPVSARYATSYMEALWAIGDRAGALGHGKEHVDLLRREFDAEPDRKVAALLDRLRSADTPESPRASPTYSLSNSGAPLSNAPDPQTGGLTSSAPTATPKPRRSALPVTVGTWNLGALVGLLVATAVTVTMILRASGIGPAASLLAAGRVKADSRVLVAEFATTGPDTSLGMVMAQAMRTSLGQSKAVRLVGASELAASLRRMTLPASTRVTEGVARDLAVREGVALLVTGHVSTVGSGYLVTARLTAAADSSDPFAEFHRAADGPGELIEAIDRLARDIRSRIGESLRSVQRAPSLARVTTSSLPALREYTTGVQLGDLEGDFLNGIAHLEAAVREDSTFALAWRKIGAYAYNIRMPLSRQFNAASAAYRFRERISGEERAEVEAAYFRWLNTSRSIAASRSLSTPSSKYRLAGELRQIGAYAEAESVAVAEVAKLPQGAVPIIQVYANLISSQLGLGALDRARATLADMQRAYPAAYFTEWVGLFMAWTTGGVDSVDAVGTRMASSANQMSRALGRHAMAMMAGARGQMRRYAQQSAAARIVADSAGANADAVAFAADEIVARAIHTRTQIRGVASLDSLAAANPDRQLPVLDRTSLELAAAYSQLGRSDKAALLISEFERSATSEEKQVRWSAWQVARGEVAFAEGRSRDALVAFRQAANPDSGAIDLMGTGRHAVRVARAFDRAGMSDSAIAYFEDFANRREHFGYGSAPLLLPLSLRRLGELYEAKGDAATAIKHYRALIRLWQNADPELQPQVSEIRRHVTRLLAAEASKR